MTNPPPQLSANQTERVAAPFERERVEELLRLFGKASRAHQLYMPNNPVYKTAHEALRAGFSPIWATREELALGFTENEVKFDGETVLEEHTRGSDSLPWIFYKDGVREIRLTKGFESEELDKLLGILQRVRKASPDEDDLLTLLWQGDFNFLRYRYVDLTVDATVPFEEGGEALADSKVDTQHALDDEEEDTQRKSSVINMSDFDATLYFLDEREIDYLQSEIRREYETDLRQNVVGVLLDIFEQQTEPAIRAEIVEVLDNFMIHMLSAGQFHNVAYLVRESLTTSQRAPELIASQRDLLSQIPLRLSAPEPLGQLLQSLDESDPLPKSEDVLELFEQLRGGALGTVFDWLGRTQNIKLRPMLEQAASRLASQNTADLVRLIPSPTQHVSLEAIRRAGVLQTGAAAAPLSKVVTEGSRDQRLAAVQSLNEIGSPGALQALERVVDDADRDVRIAAVRLLSVRAYRPALPRLEAMVKGKAIRDANLTEKMAVFEAYGSLCGEGGVATLDAMLNGKSLFGRREDAELRACAAVALGRVNTSNSQESLRKAANEKDVVVRNAVAKALRGGNT